MAISDAFDRQPASPPIGHDLAGRLIGLANRASLSYWAIRAAGALASALPLSVGQRVAATVADLVWAAWPGVRARTTENMTWVVGPIRAGAVARAAFRNYFRYLVEFLRFARMSDADLDRIVELRGVEHLHAAMATGKGAIAVGFHLGNIDLGAAVLARVGYPVNVVVDTFHPPRLDELIQRQREQKGLKLIPVDAAPRRGLKALRRGEILALLIDKPTPDDGVAVRFFDGSISIPAGAAVLALRTGAPIVPCCVFRLPGGRFLAEVAPAVDPSASAAEGTSLSAVAIMQRLVETLEEWVRRSPDQWYPFRRMWLGRHAGA